MFVEDSTHDEFRQQFDSIRGSATELSKPVQLSIWSVSVPGNWSFSQNDLGNRAAEIRLTHFVQEKSTGRLNAGIGDINGLALAADGQMDIAAVEPREASVAVISNLDAGKRQASLARGAFT
jgi:hypothetical protein